MNCVQDQRKKNGVEIGKGEVLIGVKGTMTMGIEERVASGFVLMVSYENGNNNCKGSLAQRARHTANK